MMRCRWTRHTSAIILLLIFTLAGASRAEQALPGSRNGCQFNRSEATIETALNFYGALDWVCAVDVLNLVLDRDEDKLSNDETAGAYFLLAAATYQLLTEEGQAPETIRDTVVALAAYGFLERPDWTGPYYAQVPQYLKWVEEGRALVESGALTKKKKIHGWKLACLLTAGTVAAIIYSSSSVTGQKDAQFPDFPNPPGSSK